MRSVRVSQVYVPEKIVIVPRPVTTLNRGRVTDPVDIDTVLASATTSFFCGVLSTSLLSSSDPEPTDPESVDGEDNDPESTPIGRIEPLSITPVETPPEEIESGITIVHVFTSSPEELVTTPVDISDMRSDLMILTETSGINISPVIVDVSFFLSSTPVKIDPVSMRTDHVFSSSTPVLILYL
jgi:hypothetical protein